MVTDAITDRVLKNLGHKDVQISTVFHQYLAAFPKMQKRSRELIYNSEITGALSKLNGRAREDLCGVAQNPDSFRQRTRTRSGANRRNGCCRLVTRRTEDR